LALEVVLLQRLPVLLVDMPRIVREMIEAAVRADVELDLAGVIANPSALVGAMRDLGAGFVVAGVRGPHLPAGCAELLEERPRLVLVGLDVGLGRAYVHAGGRPVRPVGDVSPERLVRLIRDLAGVGELHPD
jgi:hypothetical protein